MLPEQRYTEILKMLDAKNSITLQEIKDQLQISESTIRRDLNTLHDQGRLRKVFGGAVAVTPQMPMKTREDTVSLREHVRKEEKMLIARYAASLVSDGDFIYLDAGTTTGYMLEFLPVQNVTYVTNAVAHAKQLALRGAQVRLIGGEVKATTEALVGNEAYLNLKMYHFSLGFFGTDGVDPDAGFTTPDVNESLIKQCAMEHCRKRFVVCDASKFGQIAPVTFGSFSSATILTDQLPQESYRQYQNIICVSDKACIGLERIYTRLCQDGTPNSDTPNLNSSKE